MVNSVLQRAVPYRWHYEYGLVHKAIEQVWLKTGDARYYELIWNDLDPLITPAGNILTYRDQRVQPRPDLCRAAAFFALPHHRRGAL